SGVSLPRPTWVTPTNRDFRWRAADRPPTPPPTMTTFHGWLSGFVRAGFKLALVDIPTSLSQCRIRRRPRRFHHLPPPCYRLWRTFGDWTNVPQSPSAVQL